MADKLQQGRPRLLILSFSPIASDARVLKQVREFTPDYDVVTCGHGPQVDGVAEHIEIPSELQVWRYDRASLILRRYERAYWTNEAVAYAARALSGMEFDVVLADDVDAVPLALSLRRTGGVHADLHEYSPRLKEDQWRWRVFVAPFYRWLCRRYVTQANSASTVSPGLARRYRDEFGIDATVVTNATVFADLSPQPTSSPIRLVHSGAALPGRHLEVMIDAAIDHPAVTLDFYLTQTDSSYIERLRERATGSRGRVRVLDPVPYADLVDTLHGYDVGLMVLPPVTFSYRYALPNKVFDYVQARLGIIVGPSPEMAALVRDYALGAVTSDFTAAGLRSVFDGLSESLIDSWKESANAHAHQLSANSQIALWRAAISDLAAKR